MRLAALVLLGVVNAQNNSLISFPCDVADQCESNFDVIYDAWEESSFAEDLATEPKKGELACANMKITGIDEESGEDYAINYRGCTIESVCVGWMGEIEDK